MRILLLILSICGPIESKATASTEPGVEVTYDITIGSDTISGTRTIGLKVEKFNFKAQEEDGLIISDPRTIAKHIGDSKLAATHPFSFADPKLTQVKLKVPKGYFSFSSFLDNRGQLNPKTVSQFVVGAARADTWTKHQFNFQNTHFELLTPTKNPHIESKHWEVSVKLIWKEFIDRFGSPTNHLVFLDLEGPISGGPLGENVLGIFATEKVIPAIQEDMKANLGWSPKTTTRDYVEANYPASKNKWEEYLFGTFSHEIGHLFFGFGLTRQRVGNADDLWFSLGLGMVYDMEITEKLIGRKPQLELDIIKSWLTNYANNQNIDQRLVGPNKTEDKKYPFDRKKAFAHGKAAYYLDKVREKIGKSKFDKAVLEYLSSCGKCEAGYEDFKKYLGHSKLLSELEVLYKVY